MKKLILLFYLTTLLTACNIKRDEPTNESTAPFIEETTQNDDDNQIISMHGEIENYDRFLVFLDNLKNNKQDEIKITNYTIEGDEIYHTLKITNKKIESVLDTRNDEFGPQEVIKETYDSIIERDGWFILTKNETPEELEILIAKK